MEMEAEREDSIYREAAEERGRGGGSGRMRRLKKQKGYVSTNYNRDGAYCLTCL